MLTLNDAAADAAVAAISFIRVRSTIAQLLLEFCGLYNLEKVYNFVAVLLCCFFFLFFSFLTAHFFLQMVRNPPFMQILCANMHISKISAMFVDDFLYIYILARWALAIVSVLDRPSYMNEQVLNQ